VSSRGDVRGSRRPVLHDRRSSRTRSRRVTHAPPAGLAFMTRDRCVCCVARSTSSGPRSVSPAPAGARVPTRSCSCPLPCPTKSVPARSTRRQSVRLRRPVGNARRRVVRCAAAACEFRPESHDRVIEILGARGLRARVVPERELWRALPAGSASWRARSSWPASWAGIFGSPLLAASAVPLRCCLLPAGRSR
jgi:hypothetical protein